MEISLIDVGLKIISKIIMESQDLYLRMKFIRFDQFSFFFVIIKNTLNVLVFIFIS